MAKDASTPALRIHAVLEYSSGQAVYLGFRATDDPDPRSLANVGHVDSLLRASRDPIDVLGSFAVYVEGQPAQRWRLHRRGHGNDPVITEIPQHRVSDHAGEDLRSANARALVGWSQAERRRPMASRGHYERRERPPLPPPPTEEEEIAWLIRSERIEVTLERHKPGSDGRCKSLGCMKEWPCAWRKRAEKARQMVSESGTDIAQPVDTAPEAGCGKAPCVWLRAARKAIEVERGVNGESEL